jgi:hypothetical protein
MRLNLQKLHQPALLKDAWACQFALLLRMLPYRRFPQLGILWRYQQAPLLQIHCWQEGGQCAESERWTGHHQDSTRKVLDFAKETG